MFPVIARGNPEAVPETRGKVQRIVVTGFRRNLFDGTIFIRLLCDEVYWLKDGILERIEDISEYTRFKETWVKNEKTD